MSLEKNLTAIEVLNMPLNADESVKNKLMICCSTYTHTVVQGKAMGTKTDVELLVIANIDKFLVD